MIGLIDLIREMDFFLIRAWISLPPFPGFPEVGRRRPWQSICTTQLHISRQRMYALQPYNIRHLYYCVCIPICTIQLFIFASLFSRQNLLCTITIYVEANSISLRSILVEPLARIRSRRVRLCSISGV